MNIFITLGSILMLIGVGAGAFGAHALADLLAETGRESTYETAVRYQMYHGLALLFIGLLRMNLGSLPILSWAGWLFLIGTIIFSGSLYLLIFTGVRWLGAITPIGGLAFLAGWLMLIILSVRGV
ncbi:MAG: DUF423 domain-containing protein [Chloroflexota bacterium]